MCNIKTIMPVIIILILVLILGLGCNNDLRENAQDAGPLGEQEQERNQKTGEITDPEELERLWQEYIFDTITTIGNIHEFNSASEIDPLYIAKYCYNKYIMEYGNESLDLADIESSGRLFPLDTAIDYAKRYFNLTSLDVTKIEDYYYDPDKRSFIFTSAERVRYSHTDRNPWGLYLDKISRNNDGSITVTLHNYVSSSNNLIRYTNTYELKQREDGSLYFSKGKMEWINNNLVSLTGDLKQFDKIEGFDGNMQELSMIGEFGDSIILAFTPYDKKRHASLILLNPRTMKVNKSVELEYNIEKTDVSIIGEKVIIRLKDRIMSVAKNFDEVKEIPLPAVIKKTIERKPNYNQYGMPDVIFGGYHISSDLEKIVYSDEEGVKLLNLGTGKEKILSETVTITDSHLINKSYHSSPRFIANDKKVITTMTGYEAPMGYTVCDLEDGTSITYNISSQSSSTGYIFYDTGILEVNSYAYNENKKTSEYQTLFLDFETGDVREVKIDNAGETGILRDIHANYVGQNFAAFLTYEFGNNSEDSMTFINRLHLETLELESEVVSVKAAQTHILGVLEDGRIIFWYSLNPSESGICITR